MLRKKNQPKSRPSGKYWIGRIRSCRRDRAARNFADSIDHSSSARSKYADLSAPCFPRLSFSRIHTPSVLLSHNIYNDVVLTCTVARGRCFVTSAAAAAGVIAAQYTRHGPMVRIHPIINSVRNFLSGFYLLDLWYNI